MSGAPTSGSPPADGDRLLVAATPICLQVGSVVEIPGHGRWRLSGHGDLEPAEPEAVVSAVAPVGSVVDLLQVGFMLVEEDEADYLSGKHYPSLTLLVARY